MEAINSRVASVSSALNQTQINKTSPNVIEERSDKIAEFSGLKNNVKAEAESLKNVNDLFGALKKSEKTLNKMEKAIGEDDLNSVRELLTTTYKDEKILFNIPLKSGSYDGGSLIENAIGTKDLQSVVADIKKSLSSDLEEVKKEMLGKTATMGSAAQNSIDNSGINLDLSSISKSSNIDYLKQQMKSLLE